MANKKENNVQATQATQTSTQLASVNLSRLGFETKTFTETEDTITVNVKGDGNTLVNKAKQASLSEKTAVKALAKLETMGKEITVAKCYYLSKLKDFATECNYNSVGAYMSANYTEYKVGTCNQYARVGEAYLTEIIDENGNTFVDYKREWLKGVSPSVLIETLSLLDNDYCHGDIDLFYERYIKTKMINVDLSASKVRKQCDDTGEKPNAKKNKEKPNAKNNGENKPAEMSASACLAKVEEWIIAHPTLIEYSDNIATIFGEIAKAMEVFEMSEDVETTADEK